MKGDYNMKKAQIVSVVLKKSKERKIPCSMMKKCCVNVCK